MIEGVSNSISSTWARNGIIKTENEELYSYGLQLVFSTIFNTAIVIAVSIICGTPLAWIPFLVAFIPIRTTAGGYHAKSNLACIASFCSTYTVLLLVSITWMSKAPVPVSTSLAFASLVIIIATSPVQSSNKPLTELRAKINRKKSIILAIMCFIPAVYFIVWELPNSIYLSQLYLGEFSAAISLLLAKNGQNS